MRSLSSSLESHFARIANRYRGLRDLDSRTAQRLARMLTRQQNGGGWIRVLDVGAGTGRYTEAVLRMIVAEGGPACHGVAYDANADMIRSEMGYGRHGPWRIDRAVGVAESLPFGADTFHAVLCFNAVHHFVLDGFLETAGGVLCKGGFLGLYTRTAEQNAETVWGRLFPEFAMRETRLFPQATLREALARRPEFGSVVFEEVKWVMATSVPRLLEQVQERCYSTLYFYTPEEFARALATFRKRLSEEFPNPSAVRVRNDHLLVTARRH